MSFTVNPLQTITTNDHLLLIVPQGTLLFKCSSMYSLAVMLISEDIDKGRPRKKETGWGSRMVPMPTWPFDCSHRNRGFSSAVCVLSLYSYIFLEIPFLNLKTPSRYYFPDEGLLLESLIHNNKKMKHCCATSGLSALVLEVGTRRTLCSSPLPLHVQL